MKKIYTSILAIVLAVGLVSGAAYALFSDTVTVSGLTVSTGNADLQINVGDGWEESHDFLNNILADQVFPGYESPTVNFSLLNNSSSLINLNTVATLKSWVVGKSGDWTALRSVVEIRIRNTTDSVGTGWQTLEAWNAPGFTIPGTLSPAESNDYEIQLRVSDAAENEISDRAITDMVFDIVGTQSL